jgi:hypothetical protein
MRDWVRITVGTPAEMNQFQAAFQAVMNGAIVGRVHDQRLHRNLDGIMVPA